MAGLDRSARGPAAFEALVRGALVDYATRFRLALAEQSALPKTSVNDFVRHYGIIRSTLYSRHPELIRDITKLFSLLREEANDLKRPSKNVTANALKEEILRLKKQNKRDLAVAHSMTMQSFLAEFGPALRDGTKLISEIRSLRAENERLRQKEIRQDEIIARYVSIVKSS